MATTLAVRAETGVATSFARSLDLSDRERHLLVRRLRDGQLVQNLEGTWPPGFPVPAEQEGGFQHPGFPMGRLDPEDVLDRREGLVKGPGDLRVVLKLFFVLDFSLTQRRLARFSGLSVAWGIQLAPKWLQRDSIFWMMGNRISRTLNPSDVNI